MQTLEQELKFINPSKIDFDKHNPRSEKAESILKDPDFKDLVKSIKTYGVLEPLIIKKEMHDGFEYVLIDGERRLHASLSISLQTVPALIAESEIDGKILAYQLHMLRKIWTKIAEAKSIKGIVEDIKLQNPEISEKDLQIRIKDITNAPDNKVKELYYLTLYEDKHIEYVFNKEVALSYLIETEKVLIPKIKRNFPSLKFADKDIRSVIVKKAKTKVISNESRFLRREKKVDGYQFIDVLDDPKAIHLIEDFFNNIRMTVNDVVERYKQFKVENFKNKNTKKSGSATNSDDSDKPSGNKTNIIPSENANKSNTVVDPKSKGNKTESNDYEPIKLSQIEQTTIKDIQKKYDSIGKTFTKEELEYIQEALKCLSNGCLKASTLMIWSGLISKLLNLINKNINDFNLKSKEMQNKKATFYKHWCGNFKTDVKDIEEIREASRDMQVLCYICYIDIVDKTQFDKLKNYYQYRNNCAHPTKVKLIPNEVIALFEIIFEYVFSNSKLR